MNLFPFGRDSVAHNVVKFSASVATTVGRFLSFVGADELLLVAFLPVRRRSIAELVKKARELAATEK
jgi:hypothetical protein